MSQLAHLITNGCHAGNCGATATMDSVAAGKCLSENYYLNSGFSDLQANIYYE